MPCPISLIVAVPQAAYDSYSAISLCRASNYSNNSHKIRYTWFPLSRFPRT